MFHPTNFKSGRSLLIAIFCLLSAAVSAQTPQPDRIVLNGGCQRLILNGLEQLAASEPRPCPAGIEIFIPSATERSMGTNPRLTLSIPGLPGANVELKSASQPYPKGYVSFSIKAVNGVAMDSGECVFKVEGRAFFHCYAKLPGIKTANFEYVFLVSDEQQFTPKQSSIGELWEAFGELFKAMVPDKQFVAQTLKASTPVTAPTQQAVANLTVFGLTVGQPFPKGLPACSNEVRGILGSGWLAAPTRQPALCVGATEGGLNQSGNKRWGKYTLVPLMPSGAVLVRDLPALANFTLGNHSFVAIIDDDKVLQGLSSSSVTFDGDNQYAVINMLTQRLGVQPKVQRRTINSQSIGGGAIQVTVPYWFWRTPQIVTRYGGPENKPQADMVEVLLLTPQLASETFNIK